VKLTEEEGGRGDGTHVDLTYPLLPAAAAARPARHGRRSLCYCACMRGMGKGDERWWVCVVGWWQGRRTEAEERRRQATLNAAGGQEASWIEQQKHCLSASQGQAPPLPARPRAFDKGGEG